jgi:hypothetical protein
VKPDFTQEVDAGQKVPGVDFPGREEVVHRDLHQDDDLLALDLGLLDELRGGAVEHVDVDVRDRPEAAALDED